MRPSQVRAALTFFTLQRTNRAQQGDTQRSMIVISLADHRKLRFGIRGLVLAMTAVLTGCAGSASHDVLATHEVSDRTLDCEGLKHEVWKAQSVIDGVNKDRDDLSGADVIDGVLWFPFNLIAKSSNYEKAVEAAGARIERLEALQEERDCPQ